jgi:hypothetical protein
MATNTWYGREKETGWANHIADLSLRVTAIEEKAAEDAHRIAALEDKISQPVASRTLCARPSAYMNQLLGDVYVTEFTSAQSNALQAAKKLQTAKAAAAAANAVV